MSEVFKAQLNDVRISPRKAALVADVVRGKSVEDALDKLRILNKKAAPLFYKLINSAMANATDRATVDVDRLFVKEVFVNQGVTWKRYLPRAQGRATPIRKRTAHITVKLTEQ